MAIKWFRLRGGLVSSKWWIAPEGGTSWGLYEKTPGTQGAFSQWRASFPRQRDCKRWAEILEAESQPMQAA